MARKLLKHISRAQFSNLLQVVKCQLQNFSISSKDKQHQSPQFAVQVHKEIKTDIIHNYIPTLI